MIKRSFLKKYGIYIFILPVMVCMLLWSSTEVKAVADTKEELKEYIISEMLKFSEEIDVTDYGRNVCFETKQEVYEFASQCEGAACIVASTISSCLRHGESTEKYRLESIIPRYVCTLEDIDKLETEADKLLEGIKDNNSLSDVEKALIVHDRLIANCEYDYEHVANEGLIRDKPEVYSGYGAIVNGMAVCGGYAKAYNYLLERIGIKCEYVESSELAHAWNIVYIDDVPYYVDITWDDTRVAGYVKHEYFLLSSKKFYEKGHKADDYSKIPENTKYDNYFWADSVTEFQLLGGKIYYIDRDDAVLKVWTNGRHKELCSVADRWKKHEKRLNFSLLSNDGEKLLYSLSDAVYSYDINTGELKLVYQPEVVENSEQSIYGFTYEDGEYICELSDEPPVSADKRRVENMPKEEILEVIIAVIFAVFVGIISVVEKKIRRSIQGHFKRR